MFLFLLSKENLPLARAEAERLYGLRGELVEDCLLLDAPFLLGGLAFTRQVHELLARGTKGEEEQLLANLDYSSLPPPFRISTHLFDERELAGVVWRAMERNGITPLVDLKNPETDIHVILKNNTYVFITRSLWTNDERFSERRAHLRPANHPTSLAPKLARAMINLAGQSTAILDPFCGSGGLLIEGCLAKREMTGVDLDPRQIRRAEENLAGYGCAATLTVGDATACDALGTFDAIVTDLPYGKNSKLDDEHETFKRFFAAAAKTTKVMVVAANEEQKLDKIVPHKWAVVGSFSWYLHKSLSKRILVLERR